MIRNYSIYKATIKISLALVFICFTTYSSVAQVGINTQNPIGIFHIDANGDNSATPTSVQLNNDVIVKADATSGVGLGIGNIPHESAQIDLAASNKALGLNKVALVDPRDVTTIPEPKAGMMVYNTNSNGLVQEGLYCFTGSGWARMLTKVPQTELNFQNLKNEVVSVPLFNVDIQNGTPLDIGTQDEDEVYRIHVTESGAYAFSFRLYGSVLKQAETQKGIYRLVLLKNDVIQDLAEMHIRMGGITNANSTEALTYSITLACDAINGDGITFRLSHSPDSDYPWTLKANEDPTFAARTTMIFWKL